MASTFTKLTRPSPGADYRSPVTHRKVGLTIGAVGVVLALITLVANLVASVRLGNGEEAGGILAWSFGLTTTAFGTVKFGIAVILVGILVRIWFRWESMRETLPALKPSVTGDATPQYGDYGPATAGKTAPGSLRIHKMARTVWAPMLAMGAMALLVGFVVSLVWSGTVAGGESVTAAIALGLGTIIHVLRFQAVRVRELAKH